MISLTTNCSRLDTVCCAISAALIALLASFSQAQDLPPAPRLQASHPISSPVAVESTIEKPLPVEIGEVRPVEGLAGSSAAVAFNVPSHQDPVELQEPLDSAEQPEVLLRGPLHEAFADVYQADPQPNPIIDAIPPEPINEVPPEFKPEGGDVQWIPGYWAWDEIQEDFIWISGIWRDIPPKQRWVPGYWEQADPGFRWVSGFWFAEDQEPLTYVPDPPESLEAGPSSTAPGDDYFYCPGNWEYQSQEYVWRTGHWQPRVDRWLWVPAQYTWTPRGCIYRPGYWDYEFDVRGAAFAPIYFPQPVYRSYQYVYCPRYSLNINANFFVHMFVRPNCNQYFYGNWYGANRGVHHYRPWIDYRSHRRNYDPLLVHYNNRRFRREGVQLLSWVNRRHKYYVNHRESRPVSSWKGPRKKQVNESVRSHPQLEKRRRELLAEEYTERLGRRPAGRIGQPENSTGSNRPGRKYVRTNKDDERRTVEFKKSNRELAEKRKRNELRDRPGKQPRGSGPTVAKRPRPSASSDPRARKQGKGKSAQVDPERVVNRQRSNRVELPGQQSPRGREPGTHSKIVDSKNRTKSVRSGRSRPETRPERKLGTKALQTPESRRPKAGSSKLAGSNPLESNRKQTARNRDLSSRSKNQAKRLDDLKSKANRDQAERNARRTRGLENSARERSARDAKARAARDAQAKTARDRTAREAQLKAARDRSTRDAQARAARDAQAKTARDRTAREAQLKAVRERSARDANARAARDAQAKTARDRTAREAQLKAARDRSARDAQARAARDAQAKTARDRTAREAQFKAARDRSARDAKARAARDAQAKTARDRAARESRAAQDRANRAAQAKAARDAQAKSARDRTAREAQLKAARDRSARDAKARAARDAQAKTARDRAARESRARAAQDRANRAAQAKAARDRAQRDQAQRDASNRARERQRQADQVRRTQAEQAKRAANQRRQQEQSRKRKKN